MPPALSTVISTPWSSAPSVSERISFNQWTMNKTGFFGTIAVSTGTGAFTLSTTSGKLPAGITNSLNGGVITFAGKPTVAGTYTFTLKLSDSLGVTATQSYTIVINPATTLVWTGLGADANWMTSGNWAGGTAPLAGNTLVFGAGTGTTQKTANNNFPAGTKFAGVRFGDSGYTITGNDLKLSSGISSTSTAGGIDTVALNVALTATETFNIGGSMLIDVTGTISGTKFGVTKTGPGTLAYDSPAGNTYTGATTVSGGTLRLNTSNQIVDTASITVNAGAYVRPERSRREDHEPDAHRRHRQHRRWHIHTDWQPNGQRRRFLGRHQRQTEFARRRSEDHRQQRRCRQRPGNRGEC